MDNSILNQDYNTPTLNQYYALELCYSHFNAQLFNSKLPAVLFTTQRKHKMLGCYINKRWKSTSGDRCDEIAINPDYIAHVSYIKLMQTIVHEMAHCWQCHFGTPSRGGYHNKEWGDKMRSIGLIPSHTGKPGGNPLGQKMDDYPDPHGKFLQVCISLLKDKIYPVQWVDAYSRPHSLDINKLQAVHQVLHDGSTSKETITQLINELNISTEIIPIIQPTEPGTDSQDILQPKLEEPKNPSKSKLRYTCTGCKINVWGKSGLAISCDECNEKLLVF